MVARVVHAHHPSTGETKAGRLCSLTGTPQGAECLELLSFVPLACGGRLRGLDFPRWQLTNCPPRHLDLSPTFLVLHILSSVSKPGLLTWTHRALKLPVGLVPWDF